MVRSLSAMIATKRIGCLTSVFSTLPLAYRQHSRPTLRMISTSPVKVPASTSSTSLFWADEQCVLVDQDDGVIGSASKVACHKRNNIEQRGMLHRAFSVFLFDSSVRGQARLLMQRRASTKPTFADCYTNTCCSHPLLHMQPDELDERHLHIGIKRAARRRLQQELGVEAFPLHRLHLVGKVHYQSVDQNSLDAAYGEHEIDYILLGVMPNDCKRKDGQPFVENAANELEVSWCGYMSQNDISEMLLKHPSKHSGAVQVTPWFRFIADMWLFDWWQQLDRLSELEMQYDKSIYRAGILGESVAADRDGAMKRTASG